MTPWAACEEAQAAAQTAYEQATAPALAVYEQAIAAAWTAYEQATATAEEGASPDPARRAPEISFDGDKPIPYAPTGRAWYELGFQQGCSVGLQRAAETIDGADPRRPWGEPPPPFPVKP